MGGQWGRNPGRRKQQKLVCLDSPPSWLQWLDITGMWFGKILPLEPSKVHISQPSRSQIGCHLNHHSSLALSENHM